MPARHTTFCPYTPEESARRMELLYGPASAFTPEEQASMRQGWTTNRRRAASGTVYKTGNTEFSQAISQAHADKLYVHNFGNMPD